MREQPISRTRLVLAAKAGASSLIAWYVALLIPGADQYAYYAPFGAVLAMTFNIADSVRQSLRALLAIGIGAGSALVTDLLLPETGVAVGLLIFVGVLLGAWRPLGTMGGWIPFTAVFVLIVGDADPEQYVAAYGGLTLLGAAIATVVNLLVPPLPLSSFTPLQNRIRSTLAHHLDELAEWLVSGQDASCDPKTGRQVLAPLLIELWEATQQTVDARRINPRARWHATRARQQYEIADRWERLIHLIQETGELVAQEMEQAVPETGLEPGLDQVVKDRVAQALSALAICVRGTDAELGARREDVAAAGRVIRQLDRYRRSEDWLVTSIVVSVRRSLQMLMPTEFRAAPRETG